MSNKSKRPGLLQFANELPDQELCKHYYVALRKVFITPFNLDVGEYSKLDFSVAMQKVIPFHSEILRFFPENSDHVYAAFTAIVSLMDQSCSKALMTSQFNDFRTRLKRLAKVYESLSYELEFITKQEPDFQRIIIDILPANIRHNLRINDAGSFFTSQKHQAISLGAHLAIEKDAAKAFNTAWTKGILSRARLSSLVCLLLIYKHFKTEWPVSTDKKGSFFDFTFIFIEKYLAVDSPTRGSFQKIFQEALSQAKTVEKTILF